jgi:hypothetical protein
LVGVTLMQIESAAAAARASDVSARRLASAQGRMMHGMSPSGLPPRLIY